MSHGRVLVRVLVVATGLAGAAMTLSACESTQDTSARLGKIAEAQRKAAAKGLVITKTNPSVKVEGTWVMHDQYGSGVAVELKNTGKTQVKVPLAVTVTDKAKKVVYSNNTPGLDPSLVSMPAIKAGSTVYWVNDQVTADAPKKAKAVVGAAPAATGTLPEIALSGLKLEPDTDGIAAVGTIENRSKIPQKRLTVFIAAVKGGKPVAVGRAVIEKLLPAPTKKPVTFKAFFIGDPRGAKLVAIAPPTTLA